MGVTLLPEVERQVTAGRPAGLQAVLAGGSGLRQVLSVIFHISAELHPPLSVTDDNSLTSAAGHLGHLECASRPPLLPGSSSVQLIEDICLTIGEPSTAVVLMVKSCCAKRREPRFLLCVNSCVLTFSSSLNCLELFCLGLISHKAPSSWIKKAFHSRQDQGVLRLR